MEAKILFVDDEIKICHVMQALLARQGHDVTTAYDYESALLAIDCNEFDLIISDIILGKRDGIDILKHVRGLGLDIPVIMVTGRPSIEYASESIRLGAFDFLVKPVGKHDIVRVINKALGHRHLLDRQHQLEDKLSYQKEFYDSIIQDQTEFICRFNPDGKVTFANKAFISYFNGQNRDRDGHDVLKPEISEYNLDILNSSLSGLSLENPVEEFEHCLELPDEDQRWIRWVVRALYTKQNAFIEFQAVGQDITERKRVEQALIESQLKLEAVFQNIPEGIIAVDGRMNILQKNKSLDHVCAIAFKMNEGVPLSEISDHCGGECINVLSHVIETQTVVREYHVECRCSVEKPRSLVLTCSALSDVMGEFDGAILVIRDITRISDLERMVLERDSFRNMVGKSESMRHIYNLIGQLADIESTVLITGETGTGKELVMEALHHGGIRASNPLVRVNCSVLTENLLESELFGHVRGAFTGAVSDRKGRFQAAQGGTIFLDEIGDISMMMQLKLLRVIERKEFERVGDDKTLKADVRIIAATNKDLASCVRDGTFREDFYYRLKVMNIHLPPLAERREDIPLLTRHFCARFSNTFSKGFTGVSDEVLDMFLNYRWPGNIRELKHVIEHACILCPGGTITSRYLPPEFAELKKNGRSDPEIPPTGLTLSDLKEALEKTAGNKAMAARRLGISRSTFYRKLKELDER